MKRLIVALSLLVVFTSAFGANIAGYPERERMAIEELLERRRWADAKVSLAEYRCELDAIVDRDELEWVDYQLACCHVELGSAEAENIMLSFMDRYPSSQYGNRMLYMLACYHCDNGDLEEAKPLFEEVDYYALNAAERERYDIRLGYILFTQNDYYEASRCFANISTKSSYFEHARYYLSYIDYQSYRYDVAKEGFKSLEYSNAYRMVVPYYLLQIEYREQNYDYVISEGERLLEQSTSAVRSDLVRIVAESHFIKGNYSQSLNYILMYPAELYGRQENYIKGYSLYRLARYDDAIEPLASVCGTKDHLTQNASYHLADCYLRVGDVKSASAAFAMASDDNFDRVIAEDALLNQGRLAFEYGGVMNEALNVLNRYLHKYPESVHCAEVQSLIVAAYYKSNNYDLAYDIIKSIENPSKDLRTTLQKVCVYRAVSEIEKGNYDVARQLLDESMEIGLSAKFKALSFYWLGELAMLNGNYDEACTMYKDYIRSAPRSDKEYLMAHYGLGYAYFAKNDYENATLAFNSFLSGYEFGDKVVINRASGEYVAKEHVRYVYDAQNRFADSHFAQRHFDAARKAYNVASLYSDTTSAIYHYANYQLAIIDGVKDMTNSKLERLKKLVRCGGEYTDNAWYEMGRTYISLGEEGMTSTGIEVLKEFVKSNEKSEFYVDALMSLGLGYYNIRQFDNALETYKKVIACNPKTQMALEALRSISEIYIDERGAVDEYWEYANQSGVEADLSTATLDSLTFSVARNAYLGDDVEFAVVKLNTYLDEFIAGYNRSEALFYLSDCYIRLDDPLRALDCMKELTSYGDDKNPYNERVLVIMAPMCFDLEHYESAANAYMKLYNATNDDSRRYWAADGYVESRLKYIPRGEIVNFVAELDSLECVWPETLRKAHIVKARVLQEDGDEAAFDIYYQLSENRRTVEGSEAYYRIVERHYLNGELRVAEQMIFDMGDFGSVYWQAKCFIILGDIYRDNGNIYQASATYQSVVDGYSVMDDGIIDEAQSRINAL